MEQFLTLDYSKTLDLIGEILLDPASKPVEAMLLLAVVVIVLLMIMIVVIALVSRHGDDEDAQDVISNTDDFASRPASQTTIPVQTEPHRMTGRKGPRTRLVFVTMLLLWWLATGVATTTPAVCESCHVDSAHVVSQTADPHESTTCVRCHESGGWVGALTTGVPGRVAHIASGVLRDSQDASYGYVESDSCASCHSTVSDRTITNELKAVRISHLEPLEAGAECLDCHRARDGVIGASTTGMSPCLRCHDDTQVSGECSYCHTGDVALAITGRSVPTTASAQRLIVTPDCGGCHSQEKCDSCHGIRMPHTVEFMQYAHAREGVEDIWYNGGRTCGRCHTEESRPCTQCHKGRFPSHGTGSGLRLTHSQGSSIGCDRCHSEMAYRERRDFCVDLCHQGDGL